MLGETAEKIARTADMILTLNDLDGLPVTSNPQAVALWLSQMQMEVEARKAADGPAAQDLLQAVTAMKDNILAMNAVDKHADLNAKALAIVEASGLPDGKKPKIKDAWKMHVEPALRALGFEGKAGQYVRKADGMWHIIGLQPFAHGGSFVINLAMQPLALALAQSKAELAEMGCFLQARWLFDGTDIWWVSGGAAQTMDAAAKAAAEFLQNRVDAAFSQLTELLHSDAGDAAVAAAIFMSGDLSHIRQRLADLQL